MDKFPNLFAFLKSDYMSYNFFIINKSTEVDGHGCE